MNTRTSIRLVINGRPHSVNGSFAFQTLATYLRDSLGLIGTKIVCSEGDCGACSVLVGRAGAYGRTLRYKPIDSCIAFLYQLDKTHVVTIEGVGGEQNLSPVQNAMIRCHGSQCGFCTPGFVTTMHGLFEDSVASSDQTGHDSRLDEAALRIGLSGNLCRCTGYVQIINAARSISTATVPPMNETFPPAPMLDFFTSVGTESISISDGARSVFVPKSLQDAIEYLAEHTDARLVTGATDLGVQHNHGRPTNRVSDESALMCLSDLEPLTEITIDQDRIVIGAGATWSTVLESTCELLPEFADVLRRFGSPQIRNIGTIGGNLANASPIADSIPFLYAVDAELELLSRRGARMVSVADFYRGYKQIDLRPGELIRAVHVPRLQANETLKLYKTSRRNDMDISTFTAAISLTFASNRITKARVSLGGVGPIVVRASATEEFLTGREFNEESMRKAGSIARSEITPLSDVRGSKDYRSQLAENVLLKYFHDVDRIPQAVRT